MSACYVYMRKGATATMVILAAVFAVLLVAPNPTAMAAEAGDIPSPTVIPAGPTIIGVDGTSVNRSLPVVGDIVVALTDNVLNFNHGEYLVPGYNIIMNDYPRSFGILTLGGPNYDDSVATGVAGNVSLIKLAQGGDPTVPVKLVCVSQGSDVCSQTNDQLRAEGYDQSSVTYILLGSVVNADGGLKTSIPPLGNGIFVPGPGVTLGNASPTTGSGATIIQVLYEYDMFARAPRYPINVLADLNAVAGAALEHGNYRNADPYAAGNIVSTTPDGKITNIIIPVNEVPLLTVARMVGLPQPVADILNPTLKAVIDTAYDPIPEGRGTYPTEAQRFKLLPSKEKFQTDVENVKAGLKESGDRLTDAIESAVPKLPTLKTPSAKAKPEPKPSMDFSPKTSTQKPGTLPKPHFTFTPKGDVKLSDRVNETLSDVRKAVRSAVSNATKHRNEHRSSVNSGATHSGDTSNDS